MIHTGDCLDVMATFEAESIAAIRARHARWKQSEDDPGCCSHDGDLWPCDTATVLALVSPRLAVSVGAMIHLGDCLDVIAAHSPWARAIFAEQRLWLACSCGWNAMRDAKGTYDEHLRAALAQTSARRKR